MMLRSSTTTEPFRGGTAMTRLDPIHPGEILKHDFMEPMGLSDTALAKAIGVTPARINEIVRGRRGITAETALRLARYFSTDPGVGWTSRTATNSSSRPGTRPRPCALFIRGRRLDLLDAVEGLCSKPLSASLVPARGFPSAASRRRRPVLNASRHQ